ncbi:hypothetical protein BDV59DRAFT_176065 [Aspergillus ambiguus]|uniref:uncharacterized protein n=1 Tax=Aspergillus ambiguus TaxID=176160 RepID=UPI003CCD7238
MAEMTKPIRFLIAGAGIAGLATALAINRISNLPNVDVQLFEKASVLTEIGASIAISPNGMRTLGKLGVLNALSDDIGYRGPSGIPQIYCHWKTNEVISVDVHRNVPDPCHHTTRFHRGHLHSALLQHVPRERIHLRKAVSAMEIYPDKVVLSFGDGTVAEGDIVIGADGIRSKVRQSVIPEHRLEFTGKVFMRATFDASLVEGKIPGLPEDSTHWWGPNDNFFASRLGKGQFTTVGAYEDIRTSDEIENAISWDDEGDINFFREKFKNWNPIVRALTELTPSVRIFPNFAGNPLPTWVFGSRVTLVGDAAHTHGGAFAAGGSLALDDAFALGLSLKHVFASSSSDGEIFTRQAIQKALELYDQTRRPHTTRLLNIIHGLIGRDTLSTATPQEAEARLLSKTVNRPDTSWLTEHDVEQEFERVIRLASAVRQGTT